MNRLQHLLRLYSDPDFHHDRPTYLFVIEDLLKEERKRLNRRKQTRRNRCK